MRSLLFLLLLSVSHICLAEEPSGVPQSPPAPVEPAALSDDTPPFVGLVTGNRVNVRAGPGPSFEPLFQLGKGTRLDVLSSEGAWFAIPLPPATPVYVAKPFVSFDGNAGMIRGKKVHVRAGPGQAYSSLGRLEDAAPVTVRRAAGEWIEIEPPASCRGWINRSYVTFLEPERKEPPDGGHDRPVPPAGVQDSQGSGGQAAPER